MRKPAVENLGTVTSGTPSKEFDLQDVDEVIFHVTNPSQSLALTLEATPDGTTWAAVGAASSASASAFTVQRSHPLPQRCRVTLSAGNSPVFVERVTVGR